MAIDFTGIAPAGSAEIIKVPWNQTFPNPSTVMWWLFNRTFPNTSARFLAETVFGREITLRDDTGEEQSLRIGQNFTTTDGTWRSPTFALQFNDWVHCAIAYDHSSASHNPIIWIDGISVVVTEMNTPVGSADSSVADISIGAAPGGGIPIDAAVADFRIYDRILSDEEVLTIATLRGKDGNRNGLEAWLKLKEKAPGNTASGAGSIKNSGFGGVNADPVNTPAYIADEVSFGRRIP